MSKHVPEGVTYDVTESMAGGTSPAAAATEAPTRVTAGAAVLRMERGASEEREGNSS